MQQQANWNECAKKRVPQLKSSDRIMENLHYAMVEKQLMGSDGAPDDERDLCLSKQAEKVKKYAEAFFSLLNTGDVLKQLCGLSNEDFV
jgi:hypothetical protein